MGRGRSDVPLFVFVYPDILNTRDLRGSPLRAPAREVRLSCHGGGGFSHFRKNGNFLLASEAKYGGLL
jgi:hypothetical protein